MDTQTAKDKGPIWDVDEFVDTQSSSKTHPFFLNGLEAESVLYQGLSARQVAIFEGFIRSVVHEVVELQVNYYIRSILSSQLSNHIGKEATINGFGASKFKLLFLNQTAPTIFTNNEIEARNGKPLLVAICDTTNSNGIIKTGPLSSALVELVVLNLEFGSDQRVDESSWTSRDFNNNVVSKREGKRPLIVGNDMIICLKNGVGFIKGLSFSDNSSWTKSKKFRLGAKVVDKNILAKFPRIVEAVSKPFRVMDHRGKVYKKHHPPRREDEIWRLEGIGKDGIYHNRLFSKGIKNVDDFLKAYHKKGPTYFRKLLGGRVPQNTWKRMVNNALECDAFIASMASNPSFRVRSMGNETMGGEAFDMNSEVSEPKNYSESDGLQFDGQLQDLVSYPPTFEERLSGNYEGIIGGHDFEGTGEQDYHFIFDNDYLPLLPHGEASNSDSHNNDNVMTHEQYNQGRCWTGLVP
ncbi:calmodulin-binding protein 60 G-like isoform X2 [Cucurbita maxima]|uniref:Calmodulin-binding protein 60 G-like isoform X2 n=1 Tax=Cucurbita maxima TaxID=3661 RepID=A0A6J1I0G5_CUCMA|nr:calmodulin-binding protein 60 G-like isoform X2 [Cucurbita maxima]